MHNFAGASRIDGTSLANCFKSATGSEATSPENSARDAFFAFSEQVFPSPALTAAWQALSRRARSAISPSSLSTSVSMPASGPCIASASRK